MEKDIREVWRALRSIVKDGCTFAEIKDLVGASALPVEELSRLQQRSLPAKGASKSELLDAVDDLIKNENNPTEAIQHFLAAFLGRKQHLHGKVAECVQRFGWTLENGQLRPLDFQVEEASVDFAEEVRLLLRTAYTRYGQGDYSGAMTAVCSALDTLTMLVYEKHGLGDAHRASYQERASRSFQAFEKAYKARLAEAQIEEQEVMRIWQNYKSSVNQAAYVLGSFRRNASDVHGMSECSAALVRHAIDCGTFIIRSITSEMNADAQQLDALDL
jgi:hypothetical protein